MKWWHRIDLGDEITPGIKDTVEDLKQFKFPAEFFKGKTVLDVGAWDGFFSFHAEKMGATRVLAVDPYMWGKPGGKDGFNYSHKKLGSNVESSVIPLEEISEKTVGLWDICLFLGVFYHLEDPNPIVQAVSSVCNTLVFETHIESKIQRSRVPKLQHYKNGIDVLINGKLAHDDTTYWGPNTLYVDDLLRGCGFKDVKTRLIYSGSRSISFASKG